MKTRIFAVVSAALIFLACAHAQVVLTQSFGPSGNVGWSSPASACVLEPNSLLIAAFVPSVFNSNNTAVDAPDGISSASRAFGTIILRCPVQGIMNGVSVSDVNALAVTFQNQNGATGGCSISIYFDAANFLLSEAPGRFPIWTTSQSLSGVWTSEIDLINGIPLQTSFTHAVDIVLTRPRTAVGVCNPVAYGTYLEAIIQ